MSLECSIPFDSHPVSVIQAVQVIVDRIGELAGQAHELRQRLDSAAQFVVTQLKGQELSFMFKNKLGMSKSDAKDLFFSYKNRNKPDPDEEDPDRSQPEVETTEKKIAMIMDYMKDTSQKLDRIEDDISELKAKVEQILKRI